MDASGEEVEAVELDEITDPTAPPSAASDLSVGDDSIEYAASRRLGN